MALKVNQTKKIAYPHNSKIRPYGFLFLFLVSYYSLVTLVKKGGIALKENRKTNVYPNDSQKRRNGLLLQINYYYGLVT
jgi:hypothetical protein